MKIIAIIIVLITVLIIFFLVTMFFMGSGKNSTIPPFDVVYTWVSQHDPERDRYKAMISEDENSSHFRYNNNDELKYSIRNMFKYCGSWIKNIYIVVKDGQHPPFIDFTNPRVILVNHSEIMPRDALPTFNSLAIECCIHNIKNLSDVYVYLNDDMFVSEYFAPVVNGKIQVNVTTPSNTTFDTVYPGQDGPYSFESMLKNTMFYGKTLLNGNINIGFIHAPSVCYKPWEIEMFNLLNFNNLLNQTILSKFRHNKNIIITNSFRTLFYLTKEKDVDIVSCQESSIDLTGDSDCIIKPAKFFVVNSIDDKCSKSFTQQMEQLYPEPSPIEKS
jgi:hypothetical protein